jgi:hypothetical protein
MSKNGPVLLKRYLCASRASCRTFGSTAYSIAPSDGSFERSVIGYYFNEAVSGAKPTAAVIMGFA